MNSLPRPTPSLLAITLPPCNSTSVRTSVRPMPSPPCARWYVRSACANKSNTRGKTSTGIPTPLSRTEIIAWLPSRRAVSEMRPPSSVYFAALFNRFATICARRTGRPSE
jgi:hypothetical protein